MDIPYRRRPPDQWKTGKYWGMLYDGSEKIAQVHWTVQP